MVSDEDSSHCVALEPLPLCARLRQEANKGSESEFAARKMALLVPLVIRRAPVDDCDVLVEEEMLCGSVPPASTRESALRYP